MGVDRVVFRNGGGVVTMTPDELLPESFDARTSRKYECARIGANSSLSRVPMRTAFLVMLAVGGGPGCPRGRRP